MPTQATHSHAEPAGLACRACGGPIEADVWVIVDTAERPDLLARLRDGTLHDLTCLHCGHAATVNAPLLILRPGAEPALLFSPAGGASVAAAASVADAQRKRDEEQAAALVGILREHMGADWREAWLAHGLTGAARAALPALLADDPATAARLAAAHAAEEEEVPPAVRRALEEVIAALAAEGVRVQAPADLARALEARPALRARVEAALRGDAADA